MPDVDNEHFPRKYDENYLYLLDVDPTHIHVFWEIIPDCIPNKILKRCMENKDLWLKIYCKFRDLYSFCVDLNVQGLINDWFIEIESPLANCHAELGYNDPVTGKFVSLCKSNNLYVFPEELSNSSTIKKNQGTVNPHAYKEKQNDKNPFYADPEKDRKPHLMEHITEKDIKDYYRVLSEKRISNPGFSPWRSLLEKINSEEALRVLKPSGSENFGEQHFLAPETNSSYWSAVSSSSPIFKTDKDK